MTHTIDCLAYKIVTRRDCIKLKHKGLDWNRKFLKDLKNFSSKFPKVNNDYCDFRGIHISLSFFFPFKSLNK